MEMKVDSQKIILNRQQNAWSQQHLSDVSGLSLRTIQRIENTQAASQDSIKALAAAFDVTPDALLLDVVASTPKTKVKANIDQRKTIYVGLVLLTLLVIAYWSQSVVATHQKRASEPAQTSVVLDQTGLDDALKWLKLVDEKSYAESWQQGHVLFQAQLTDLMWEEALRKVREPLGLVINRVHSASNLIQQLPGMPDGNYVMMSFNTRFENKASSIETLTLSFDNGVWKPIGYFIR